MHHGYKMNKSHRTLVFSILPALTPLLCWSTWRQLDLSLIFLRSQILTVWSTEAVASSQSQWELNSTWVTFFLCSFKFHIYDGYKRRQMFFCCRAQDSGLWILGRENSSSHPSVLINVFKGWSSWHHHFISGLMWWQMETTFSCSTVDMIMPLPICLTIWTIYNASMVRLEIMQSEAGIFPTLLKT